MAALNFDANQVEPTNSLEPIPAGKYVAVITDSEMKPTKAGTGQETELRYEQHEQFRQAAFGDGTYGTIDWYFNSGYPGEWRDVFYYAEALSKFDAQFDYRLPTLQELTFACKDGYDQTCPDFVRSYGPANTDGDAPNKFGVFGLNNGNVECCDIPGLFFGRHGRPTSTPPPPDCRCDWWTKGNADADDGLNELITARFVLVMED
ncbi:DUF669 domain-containing protein [Novipirellula artificiosorum]|uniref:Sulfatase-modifying factor enzyme domain-containing protein n=1 Tax=Novipirellula artificiosorum TaxID=2528016 RepID=A0A5C6DRM0_9BACT|nr:DUF669 domain-containing protein [Novipirellula artificiosorum]TWU39480.1 hypothetical protein Poly41_23040 [Novipirellula artificiosorum]